MLVTDTRTIGILADLGLVLLLFALGLDFGWQRVRQVGMRVVFIGVVEIAFMLAVGYQVGTLLGWKGSRVVAAGSH